MNYWIILVTFLLLSYMAYWDYKVRRVPNWLLLIASVPIPYVLVTNFTVTYILMSLLLILGLVVFRWRGWWATGDTKTALWLGGMLGAMPAAIVLSAGTILALVENRRREPLVRGIPFIVYLLLGFMVVYGVIVFDEVL